MSEQSKGLESIPGRQITELTLERRKKMPSRNLKEKMFPVYGTEKFKVKIAKLGYTIQLEAQKIDWKMHPENLDKQVYFLAWIANKLIRKADPYWDKSVTQLMKMFCDETFLELTVLFKDNFTDNVKKKLKKMEQELASPLLGKI